MVLLGDLVGVGSEGGLVLLLLGDLVGVGSGFEFVLGGLVVGVVGSEGGATTSQCFDVEHPSG